MVLQACRISFTDVNKLAYFGGDTVSGVVSFSLNEEKKIADLTFQAKGQTKVSWTETTGTGDRRKSEWYYSHEVHFRTFRTLLEGYKKEDDGQVLLQPGDHTFSFSFDLPYNIPPSIERHWGQVRYTIKITAVRSKKFDDHFRMPFSVATIYDLNTNPACGAPVTRHIQKEFGFLFVNKGTAMITTTLPITGFVPGQDLTMHCEIKNTSKVKIVNIKFSIVQLITFVSTYPLTKSKPEVIKIVAYAGKGADKNEEVNYPVSFKVPALPPTSLFRGLITREYFLKVKAVCDTMNTNPCDWIPITIGSIPLCSSSDGQGYNNSVGIIDYNAPSTSEALDPTAPSAPPQIGFGQPPPYSQLAPPTYVESQFSHKMSEAGPGDKDDNVQFSPVYPVYNFPPVNNNKD